MRKSIFQAMYTLFMSLFIYSCSELVLPEQIGIKGTLNLPIKAGAADLNQTLREKIEEVFSANEQENTKVYTVDYIGQTVQTFCIYIPIEMTEDLNPNNFLKIIDDQINGGINMPPKTIDIQIPSGGIPIGDIKTLFESSKIPSVSLADIAVYVKSIDFEKCNEENDLNGIGLNFYIKEKIPDGLEMIIKCEELCFSSAPVLLKQGDNIFGNKDKEFTLILDALYQNDIKKLNFAMEFQPAKNNPGYPDTWNPVYFGGATNRIKGEIRLFRNWKQAKIDLAKALKASAAIEDFGKFPAEAFDLSRLKKYFDGGFDYNGLEVKIYMDGPDPELIDYLGSKLLLRAQYGGKTGSDGDELYHETLFINKDPIKMDRYLDKNGFYKDQHLPENTSEYDGKIDDETIVKIFKTMPSDLSFIFTIKAEEDKYLIITPDAFNNIDNSGAIRTTMMIMMPMSLKATGDSVNKSVISLPNMFGEKDDLFGRKEPKELFSKGKIDYIRLIIDFSSPIFTEGCLFINKEKELFPDGVRLNGNKIELNFTKEQLNIIEEKLIVPDIKIEIDNGGTVSIPKDMAIMSIRFEIKGLINIGEH